MQWWMAEVHLCLFNIARHGNINCLIDVLLQESEIAVLDCLPVFSKFVMFFEGGHEVQGTLPAGVFDGEVID